MVSFEILRDKLQVLSNYIQEIWPELNVSFLILYFNCDRYFSTKISNFFEIIHATCFNVNNAKVFNFKLLDNLTSIFYCIF